MAKKARKVEEVIDAVTKLTELEAMKFGKIDAEIRNAALSIQVATYKKQEYRTEYEIRCRQEDEKIAEYNMLIKKLRPEYEALMKELIEKYKISDVCKLSIDPDTRVIREIN